MKPQPDVAQQQANYDKQQPQVRIAGAGEDPRLTPLPIAGFDAEPRPIQVSNLAGRTRHAPGSEQELLLLPLAVFAVLVGAVRHVNRKRRRLRFVRERVGISADFLPLDPMQTRGGSLFLFVLEDRKSTR